MAKEYKSYSMELAGRTLTVDIGRVAAQANGAALMHYGCEHHCKAAEISPDMPRHERTEDAPPLAYLTWSAYSSMAEMVISIFGEMGRAIAEQVKQEIIQEFGMEIWQQIVQYSGMNLDAFMRV